MPLPGRFSDFKADRNGRDKEEAKRLGIREGDHEDILEFKCVRKFHSRGIWYSCFSLQFIEYKA